MFVRVTLVSLVAVAFCLACVQAAPQNCVKGTKMAKLEKHLEQANIPFSAEQEVMEIDNYRATLVNARFRQKELGQVDTILYAAKVSQAPECTAEEFMSMDQLDKLLAHQPLHYRYQEGQGCDRHVDHAAHNIIVSYFESCTQEHEKALRNAIAGVDALARKTSESLMSLKTLPAADGKQATFSDYSSDLLALVEALRAYKTAEKHDLEGIIASIKRVASPDDLPKDKAAVSQSSIANLLKKYVIEGCKSYVDSTEQFSQIFVYRIHLNVWPTDTYQEFSSIIGANSLCKTILKNEKTIAKNLLSKWTI